MVEEAVDNWEDLLNDDADFKIVQLKDDEFEDEGVEADQQVVHNIQTGPAKPSEKKLEQKEKKRRMQEKLETTKKKYEENAFGNMMLPQDKRNLKLQQILLSKRQDEMNIASLVGEEEKLEIPKLELQLSTKENITIFVQAVQAKLQTVAIEFQQAMVNRGLEEAIKQLNWSSKETGKMFEKVKAFLVSKEKRERGNKKDKKKQGQVNLSKAATKKLAVEEEDEPSEEEVFEVVESDEEEKKETEQQLNGCIEEVNQVKMETQEQTLGFIVRINQIMKLIQDEKNKKEWSMEILLKIAETACEASNSKDWKSNVLDRVKEIHNNKMNEEKGSPMKNKNLLVASVNIGKATENAVAMAEKEEELVEDEFDPDEDFM